MGVNKGVWLVNLEVRLKKSDVVWHVAKRVAIKC